MHNPNRSVGAVVSLTGGCLTVRLQALSVPRSLPPEGDHGLGLRLVVQRLHAARRVGAVKRKRKKKREEAAAQ